MEGNLRLFPPPHLLPSQLSPNPFETKAQMSANLGQFQDLQIKPIPIGFRSNHLWITQWAKMIVLFSGVQYEEKPKYIHNSQWVATQVWAKEHCAWGRSPIFSFQDLIPRPWGGGWGDAPSREQGFEQCQGEEGSGISQGVKATDREQFEARGLLDRAEAQWGLMEGHSSSSTGRRLCWKQWNNGTVSGNALHYVASTLLESGRLGQPEGIRVAFYLHGKGLALYRFSGSYSSYKQ